MRSLSKGSRSSTLLYLVCAVWPLFGSNRVAMRTQSVIHSPNGSSHPCARLIAVSLLPASLPPTPSSFSLLSWLPSLCRPFCRFISISTLGNAVYPSVYALIVVSIGNEGAQILVCFGRHNNNLDVAECRLIFLGWRMAR